MSLPVNSAAGSGYYADFSGLEALKKSAKSQDPQAVRQVARQFESLLTSMLLKSMRETRFADSLGDSEQTQFYQDMYDQQLAMRLSQGKGIGLADMLVQQLLRSGQAGAAKPGGAAPSAQPGAVVGATAGAATAAPRGAVQRAALPNATAQGLPRATPAARLPGIASVDEHSRFVQRLAPYAEQASGALGVSADTLIAQAALETGWGRHLPGGTAEGSSFNLYGVKAGSSWSGAAVSAQTVEYRAGQPRAEAQAFRRYGSLQQGVTDYVNLLQASPRYQAALGSGADVEAFGTALQRGGYATDPAYVQKLAATAVQVRALRAPAAGSELKLAPAQPSTPGVESA